jgi:hypothetical protein
VPSAPRADVDDACSFAWLQLLTHTYVDLSPAPIGGLASTAIHETWRLGRRSLARPVEQTAAAELVADSATDPSMLAEHRERLAQLEQLPRRRRRFLWLRGIGLSHEEMTPVTATAKAPSSVKSERRARDCVASINASQTSARRA